MRRHGVIAIVVAGVIASGAWLLQQNHQLDASEESTGSFREAFQRDPESPVTTKTDDGVRLNFFETGWERVLQNVADQAELTLVMDRVPHGRYARRDRGKYRIDSAVGILNSELERLGFRLIHQGNFLVVMKLDQVRTRYARPVLADQNKPKQGAATQVSSRKKKNTPFSQASARRTDTKSRVTWASRESKPSSETNDEFTPMPTDSPSPAFTTNVAPRSPHTTEAASNSPTIQTNVRIRNTKASEVARSIYLVFESKAELVRKGLHDLPTFVVRNSESDGEESKPQFRIGIDQPNSQLVIEASASRTKQLKKLIAQIDKTQTQSDETVRLMPGEGVSDEIARNLSDQIHRMVALRQKTGEEPVGAAEPNAFGDDNGSLSLRGDVNIEAMQDLGILILKGSQTDVQKVETIIRQLEELSIGSRADTHLLSLKHVNSDALATLLKAVYQELATLRQRGVTNPNTVAFIPVVRPNAVLILAPAAELDAILKLAADLDQRTDPNSEFQVFSLKNAIASQVARSLETFYAERGGLGTRVRIVADIRTNAVIVQGRANDLEEVNLLVEKMDRDQPGAIHQVQVVELKHATAVELAETISSTIQSITSPPRATGNAGFGGDQGAQELRDSRSVALEFLTANNSGGELIRSGILVDVRVSADARSNTLLVSAPESSMPLMLALIQQLDGAPTAVAEIKVFTLENADAEQSVELLTTMFENQNQEDQLGVQIAGTQDAASSLVSAQFTADIRTNTVLAIGSAEFLSVVEAILLRLDTSESRQRETVVVPLRNVRADDVAEALEDFLEQQQGLQDSSEEMISNIERLRQEVIVAPDNNSNSLIVSASPEYFSQISHIINELDASPPQVVIQALLVEVQLDNTDEFGVELGFQDPTLFSRSLLNDAASIVTSTTSAGGVSTTVIESRNTTPGFNFNNTISPLGNNSANTNTSTVASQGISNFSLGRQNGDLGFGGFVFSAQSDAVSVLVRALAARRTVHVLSRPQIRTTHNNTASIRVGQQVPVVNGVTTNANFVTPQIEQQNVGIILEVTPRVTPDGTISMDVMAEKSALAPGGVPVFTDATTGNVVESVIIDSATADTTVAVPNGQTIVIGGMITKSDDTLERKVPWLGDIPLIGSAFRYDATNTARTELLIFLTPRIVYSDADSELIKQIESERMHFLESEAEEIHGPLFSVPPSGIDTYEPSPMPIEQYEQPIPADVLPPPNNEDLILLPTQTQTQSKTPAKTVASK